MIIAAADRATAGNTIDLQAAINDAIGSSFDLQIADVRVRQFEADKRMAKADYYPTLAVAASSEFDKGLKQTAQPVFSVGNSTFNAVTRFQELASLQASWIVNDFGARANSVKAAHYLGVAARTSKRLIARDLRVQVIDFYGQALALYRQLLVKHELVLLNRQLFAIKLQTYRAGAISRVELGEQALQLAQAEDAEKELKTAFNDRLRNLTTLTHREYSADDIQLQDFGEVGASREFVPEKTPDWAMFESQIKSKKAELNVLSAQRFPQTRIYGGYLFYGTDRNNLGAAFGSFSHRMADIGVTVQWSIFDGFKNAAQRQRKREEIAELELQRKKRLCELQYQYQTAQSTLRPLAAQLSTKAEVINKEQQKVQMYKRLGERKVSDPCQEIIQRIQLIEQQAAEEKIRIERAIATQKLKAMVES